MTNNKEEKNNHFEEKQDDNSLQENKKNIFAKFSNWCKHTFLYTTCYYVFFTIISFVIILVCIIFLNSSKYINFKLIGVKYGMDFGIVLMIISNVLHSTKICTIFLIIFILLVLKKKFYPFFFFIPFIIIFLLVNSSISYLYRNDFILSNSLDSILFFIQFYCLFLPFAYIPFIILFGIISTIIYFKYKNSQINRKDLK